VKKKLGIAWRISYTLNCAWQEGLRNTKAINKYEHEKHELRLGK
jgi:hypothetical protein